MKLRNKGGGGSRMQGADNRREGLSYSRILINAIWKQFTARDRAQCAVLAVVFHIIYAVLSVKC